ncbi:MAG: 2,3-bisphosphoglycerate-independent phosphoglycerate mutase [Chromatiales bacterium]|nr:2,3-bisphosphoglycerate-independent phosphoglycerate mutase [Chromatiales bacterium]
MTKNSATSTTTPALGQVPRRPVLLIILDGFGCNPSRAHNAVALAQTPNLDRAFATSPHTLLQASGSAVGLPDGQMGNSEVGHMTIGCGSILRQDLVAIDQAIVDGSFYTNTAFLQAINAAKAKNTPVHLIGLVSDGGVHSHIRHLYALLQLCNRHGVKSVVHAITDGRDVAPRSALDGVPELAAAVQRAGGVIGSVCGRFYAMDRDHRWERTELAFRAMVQGDALRVDSAEEAIRACYERDSSDEFVQPAVLPDWAPITAESPVICFNFRRDRPRQLLSALFREDFDGFDRGDFQPVPVTCMTQYDQWWPLPYAFAQDQPATTLAKIVSEAGLRQFHCAETEKYAHVTFFLNGGHGDLYSGEVHEVVPSPPVATYDLMPEMSAAQVSDTVIGAMTSGDFSLIVVNYANGDMVGHTAVREAVIRAVETLDLEVGRLLDVAKERGYSVLLTADHGNCDEMVDPVSGQPHTQHTVYPVPCLVVDPIPWRLSVGAGLSSIAPTVLQLMGLQRPPEMSGASLLLGE